MPIPESPRVTYERNTLKEVVCQLRFPSILRIGSEPPVRFQELMRGSYPRFKEQTEAAFTIPQSSGLPPELSKLVPAVTTYEFGSMDAAWRLTLTREFIALTCTKYTTWEKFLERLKIALDALALEYQPAFFGRIGLRYRNVITRSQLGVPAAPWSSLLKPYAIGELASPLHGEVEGLAKETVLVLAQFSGRTRVLHATIREEGQSEDSFLIDCDYFTDQETPASNAIETLNYFNKQSGNLFRWYVEPQLHAAMAPRAL